MSTKPIAAALLGPETERLIQRESTQFRGVLHQLDDDDWGRGLPRLDASVGAAVQHLLDGFEELAETMEEREARGGQQLFRPLGHQGVQDVPDDPGKREDVIGAYEQASDRVNKLVDEVGLDDWSWPSPSPLGGVETLAEAARRCLAHHYVHRHDVIEALDRDFDPHEETIRLVVESVLDMIARKGGEVIDPPMVFELVTVSPGAGAWALQFDPPEQANRDDFEVWKRLVNWEQDEPPPHRVERGRADAPRVTVRTTGDLFWRAGFGRGPTWEQLDTHGDDEGIEAWQHLVETTT